MLHDPPRVKRCRYRLGRRRLLSCPRPPGKHIGNCLARRTHAAAPTRAVAESVCVTGQTTVQQTSGPLATAAGASVMQPGVSCGAAPSASLVSPRETAAEDSGAGAARGDAEEGSEQGECGIAAG
eukprot:361431-Chlamydomonas_euryale.AAC.1